MAPVSAVTNSTIIRAEDHLDAAAVREVNDLAFGSPFEAGIVDRLRGTPGVVSLVASQEGQVVGHILFSPVSLHPPGSHRVAGLGPMSVRPGHQRGGIGSLLVRAGLDACRQHGYAAAVVLGHPAFYPRFGFEPARRWGLRLSGFEVVPEDAFMALELEAGVRQRLSGAVHYPAAFSEA